MTELDDNGLQIDAQDLGSVSPTAEDNGRLYNHDGSSSITLTTGSTTTNNGFYMWDDGAGAWHPLKLTLSAAEDLETQGSTAIVRDTTNGLDIARFLEGGHIEFPNGDTTVRGGYLSLERWGNQLRFVDTNNSVDNVFIDKNGISTVFRNAASGNKLFTVGDDGSVGVPNGPLSIQGSQATTQSDLNSHESTTTAHGDAVPLSITHANWADGLSNEEIHRIKVPPGKKLEAHSLDLQIKGGGSSAGLTVDVYDVNAGTVLISDDAGSGPTTGSPAGSSGDAAVVVVRLSNSTGNTQTASITGSMYLV
jgi:hypothetical protein